MEICSENDDLDGDVSNFVMMHAEIKRNDDPFLRFLNRDISEKHLRYTDLDSDFKVLTQKMLPELAKLALLKTIVEMLGSLEREMLVSSMTDFFYQVLGSVTWHAGQSDLERSHRNLGVGRHHVSPPHPVNWVEVRHTLAALLLRSRSGSKKGRAANPLRSPLCTPAVPAPFGNPGRQAACELPHPSPSLGEGG
ncbi:hypothetical protein PAPYR_12956 [Paratrimastix pyriformis]|uniref:Uncharacterized protein n=1 Tax=Paratrimastix pyriformis TaxID=342808 RepID=A0ABQ8U3A0_9EUKA|nr:hypothetical protein PAPYR_12956 [Paratrimastix pyriformis]